MKPSGILHSALAALLIPAAGLSIGACSLKSWNQSLPPATDLHPPSGYMVARTVIHLHSPYSWDACKGTSADDCLAALRAGLCMNEVDFAFLTDHPDHMVDHEMIDLLFHANGDTLIQSSGSPIANQITCPDGHVVTVTAGYEDRLMPIGMTQQLDPSPSVRASLYITETAALVSQLKTQAGALVIVPHTESRTVSEIAALGVDAIEIYNLHANVNPKIRHNYLGLDYFAGIADLSVYWIDPFHTQQPDLAFLSFFTLSPVYAQTWDALMAQGLRITGVGGNDSHQNFFPWNGSDGEKLDSHRRIIRWLSNHVLVTDLSLATAKNALRAGHSYLVIEGLGTPVGADFHASNGTASLIPGDAAPYVAGRTSIHVSLPSLHAATPHEGDAPQIKIYLKRIDNSGNETVVATQQGGDLDYAVSQSGFYRPEISIVPLHLSPYLKYQSDKTRQELPWIISNPFYFN